LSEEGRARRQEEGRRKERMKGQEVEGKGWCRWRVKGRRRKGGRRRCGMEKKGKRNKEEKGRRRGEGKGKGNGKREGGEGEGEGHTKNRQVAISSGISLPHYIAHGLQGKFFPKNLAGPENHKVRKFFRSNYFSDGCDEPLAEFFFHVFYIVRKKLGNLKKFSSNLTTKKPR
jgi:hypothetical protein